MIGYQPGLSEGYSWTPKRVFDLVFLVVVGLIFVVGLIAHAVVETKRIEADTLQKTTETMKEVEEIRPRKLWEKDK